MNRQRYIRETNLLICNFKEKLPINFFDIKIRQILGEEKQDFKGQKDGGEKQDFKRQKDGQFVKCGN